MVGNEVVHIVVCSESIIHVITQPGQEAVHHPQPWLMPSGQSCQGAPFQFSQDAKHASVKTARLLAEIALDRGNLSFTGLRHKAKTKI